MANYTVSLTATEEKAILSDVASIQDWLDNAAHNKARQCIDEVVRQHSDKNPAKLSPTDKAAIVAAAPIIPAADIPPPF